MAMTMAAHYNNSIIDLSTCSSSDDEEDTTSFHCEQQQQRRRRLTTMPNLTSTSPSPCLRGGYRQRLLSLHRHRNGNHHAAASSSAAAAAASTSSSAAATRERRAERPEIIEISSSPSLSPLDRTTSRTTKKMSSSDKQQARARARQWAENNLASMSSSSSSRARVDNAPTVTAGVAAPIQRHMSLSAARDEARARARQWAQGTAAANAITSSGSGRQLDSEDVEEEEDDDDDDIPDDPMSESSMSSAEESPSLHPRQQPFAQPATTTTTATTGTTTTTSVSYSWVSRAPSSSTTPSTNVSLQRQQPTILAPPPSSPSSLSDTFSRHQQLFDQQFNGFAQQFNGASFVRLGSGNQIAQWSSSPSVHLESLQPQLRLHNIDSILATAAAATAEAEAITAAAATATAAAVRANCATARATATAAIARANSATSRAAAIATAATARAAAFESLQEEEEDSLEDEEDSLDDDDDESSTESRRDQEDAQVWSCPQCTLHNPMFHVQCDACQYVNRTLILGTGVASRQLSFHASFGGGGGGGGGEWGRDRTRAIPQMTAIPQRIRPFNQPALQSENMGYERLLEIFGDGSENMRRGASSSIISALPSVNIVDPERQLPEDKRECSICLEEFCGGEVRTSLPCLHGFHSGCVNRWLQSNGSCPVCKTSVS